MSVKKDREITPTEAFRGVYVDFEGFTDEPPVLIGQLTEYEFEQTVVDPRFRPASYSSDCGFKRFGQYIQDIIDRCRSESRVLVCFTRHEKNVIERHTDATIDSIYRDAHKIGKRWINRCHRGATSGNTFDDFMTFLGYQKPTYMGNGKTTHRLRSVLNGLQATNKEGYEDLTRVQKTKWTNVLKYNRVDCMGMRDLVIRAASEIDASSRD